MDAFWATRLPSSIVIYCKRTFILREICHNSQPSRMRPPPHRLLNLPPARWVTLSNTETCPLCHTWAGAVLHYGEGKRRRENLERRSRGAERFHPPLLNEGASAGETRRRRSRRRRRSGLPTQILYIRLKTFSDALKWGEKSFVFLPSFFCEKLRSKKLFIVFSFCAD